MRKIVVGITNKNCARGRNESWCGMTAILKMLLFVQKKRRNTQTASRGRGRPNEHLDLHIFRLFFHISSNVFMLAAYYLAKVPSPRSYSYAHTRIHIHIHSSD